MSKGAFQTSREIFENPIWTDVVKFRIFFYIYGNAVFAKEGVTVADVHVGRGQYLRSYRNLQKDLAYTEKRAVKQYSLHTIKNKIDQLVKENRIQIKTTDYGTLFTVVNYEEYQGFERYSKSLPEQQRNSNGTASEQQRNNNKNVKKDKNVNNVVDDRESENIIEVYEKVFGSFANPMIIENINYWCQDLSEELVIAALKRSGENGAFNFKYTERILRTWEKHKVQNLDDVAKLDEKFEQQKNKKQQYQQPNKSNNQPQQKIKTNSEVNF